MLKAGLESRYTQQSINPVFFLPDVKEQLKPAGAPSGAQYAVPGCAVAQEWPLQSRRSSAPPAARLPAGLPATPGSARPAPPTQHPGPVA